MDVLLVLGNQLFHPMLLARQGIKTEQTLVFMREDRELCTHFRFHQHKIVLFLAAMREYAKELREYGFKVHYESLGQDQRSYDDSLADFLRRQSAQSVYCYEIEDKFFETRIHNTLQEVQLELRCLESPMFLTSRGLFRDYLQAVKKPFMKTFYEKQRQRLSILVDEKKKPVGGKWSFDEDNRKALPVDVTPPKLPGYKASGIEAEVIQLVKEQFADHPGNADEFWLPCGRAAAQKWLELFLKQRLADFGPYEDALAKHSPFVFHSVLTPYLNTGLLTPSEVLNQTLKFAHDHDIPLQSLEGFVRQILGWREFVRGIYQNFSEIQDTTNFWQHKRRLTAHWYQGNTGIEPLDFVIKKSLRYGYAHHIERLMVVGNLMLLLEVDPQVAHRWFMEMYVDSSDWVMGPNVYGMALYSDAGIFASKPYICGSNYYRKMGPYKSGDWQDGVDGLYWGFIQRHRDFFLKNPRLGMMVRTMDKIPADRMLRITKSAESLRDLLTSC